MKLIEFMYDGKWFGLDVAKMSYFIWLEQSSVLELVVGGKKFVFKGADKAPMIYQKLHKALDKE